MCIYCECSCQEEYITDDISTCSRDEEFYNICEICEGELESESEINDCYCCINGKQNYVYSDMENCDFCQNIANYDPSRNIERYVSLGSVESHRSRYGIKQSNIVMENTNMVQIKNNNHHQKAKGSGKKREMRFCNKEVTCLLRKNRYNITIVPLPKGSKSTEVITKPIRPKPKTLIQIDTKIHKMKIASPKINK